MAVTEIVLQNERDLKNFVKSFAKKVSSREVILLVGELGSGKTTFAKYFINYFLPLQEVTSPTFPIVNVYTNGEQQIFHYDLYRIKTQEELQELNLIDAIKDGICLIEWPEIAYNYLPEAYTIIKIEHTGDATRKLKIKSYGKIK